MGRPKANKPKEIIRTVRFDEEMDKRLNEYCRVNGMTRTLAIRSGVTALMEKNK